MWEVVQCCAQQAPVRIAHQQFTAVYLFIADDKRQMSVCRLNASVLMVTYGQWRLRFASAHDQTRFIQCFYNASAHCHALRLYNVKSIILSSMTYVCILKALKYINIIQTGRRQASYHHWLMSLRCLSVSKDDKQWITCRSATTNSSSARVSGSTLYVQHRAVSQRFCKWSSMYWSSAFSQWRLTNLKARVIVMSTDIRRLTNCRLLLLLLFFSPSVLNSRG